MEPWTIRMGRAFRDSLWRWRLKFTHGLGSPFGPGDNQYLFMVITTKYLGKGGEMLSVDAD